MRFVLLMALSASLLLSSGPAIGQGKKKEEEFIKEKPTIGDRLPDLTVYRPDGGQVKTSSLRGEYVVLTFGCLT